MAWARVALLHAAGEGEESLDKTASLFGYRGSKKIPQAATAQNKFINSASPQEGILSLTSRDESPRPPARFLRVKKFIEHHPENNSRPQYLTDPNMQLSGEVAGSFSFPSASSLMPPSRLIPFLLTNLGVQRESNQLNHKLITKKVSQGKALLRLPYRHKKYWPKRLQIIVDTSRHLEPYWIDFESIVSDLKRQLGEQAVTVVSIDEDTMSNAVPTCLHWPSNEDDLEEDWLAPAAGEPILILSDLGMSHPQSRQRVRWRRFAKKHLQKANTMTLSPAYRSPICEDSVRCLRPNPLWDLKLPKYAHQHGFSNPEIAKEKLAHILTLLSALPLVDTALLRKLRGKLDWGSSELEGLVWNHRDIIPTGLGICIDPAAAEPYRKRYKKHCANTPEASLLWKTVAEHHQDSYQGLKHFESYSRTALEGHVDDSGRVYMQQLAASIAQSDEGSEQHQGLVAQCRSVLSFCPDSLDNPELSDLAHELLTVAYRDEIERQDWQAIPLTNARLDKIQSIVGSEVKQEYRWWQIVQTGDQGEAFLTHNHVNSNYYAAYIKHFKAPINLPVTIKSHPDLMPKTVEKESMLDIGDNEVVIENGLSTLVLDAIHKPRWATAIGAEQGDIWVEIQWGDEQLRGSWNLINGNGYWHFDEPFGVDQYGLYTDLPFTPDIAQRFRWIPPGTFQMGSPKTEPERYKDETQHEVTLTQGYWLADTTVTQAQWQAIVGKNPSHFEGSNLPVERVSWDDSQNFIQKLNKVHEPLSFQLPTEAQWEYACRAGTTMPFSVGENVTPEQVNYDGSEPYNKSNKGEDRSRTVAVKSLPCNKWGLYEMHGNVWEWCQDYWQEDLGSEAVTDPKVEQIEQGGALRVLRGGSWNRFGRSVRSAIRRHLSPDYRDVSLGLRLSLGQPSGSSRGGSRHESQSSPAASTASRVAEQRPVGMGDGLLSDSRRGEKSEK